MVCSASSKKSTHLFFDEKPMPKVVLFQGVNKFVRHEKGPNRKVRALSGLRLCLRRLD